MESPRSMPWISINSIPKLALSPFCNLPWKPSLDWETLPLRGSLGSSLVKVRAFFIKSWQSIVHSLFLFILFEGVIAFCNSIIQSILSTLWLVMVFSLVFNPNLAFNSKKISTWAFNLHTKFCWCLRKLPVRLRVKFCFFFFAWNYEIVSKIFWNGYLFCICL